MTYVCDERSRSAAAAADDDDDGDAAVRHEGPLEMRYRLQLKFLYAKEQLWQNKTFSKHRPFQNQLE